MRIFTRLITRDPHGLDMDVGEPVTSFGVHVANRGIRRTEVNSKTINSSFHNRAKLDNTRSPKCETF